MHVMHADRLKILLVEDNEDDFLIVRELLRDADAAHFDLEWVKTYEDGLEAIRAQRHDLILLNFRLSNRTGLELLEETQSFSLRMPIILMTRQRDHDLDMQAMRMGACDYLVKDHLDADRLERAIRYAVERQKSAEAKHSENAQAQLAAIIESSDDAIFSKTLDGLIVTWNKAAETLYGYKAREMIGKSVCRLSPLHAQEEMISILERVRRGERVGQFETVHQHRDGRLINVSLAVSPIIDAAGHVTSASSIARDISKQKRVETRLRQSEASLAVAQRIAHFGSWELELGNTDDINANLLHWSDETFRIFGYEPDSVTVTNELFFRAIPPEDHPAIQHAVAAAVARRQSYSFVHRVRHPDGEERIVRETAQFFEGDAAGQSPRLVGTVHDITEQQRAEEHNRFNALLLSQVRNAVIATDQAGQITYWNNFAETLYQWKSEEVLGKNIGQVTVPPQGQKAGEQILCQIQEKGNWEGEFLVQRKDGSTFPAYVVDTLFQDAYGSVAGLVGVSIDITELKQAEDALREAEREQRQLAARLAEAQAIAKVGSWETDLSTMVLSWSAETYRIFEVDPGQCSPTHQDFLQIVHPEDRTAVAEAFVQSLEQSETCTIEHRLLLSEGRIKFVEERWQAFKDNAGNLTHALGTCQDITDRRQAEEERDRFFTLSLDMLAIVSNDGSIKRLNPAFEATLGFSNAELMANPFLEFVHPDDLRSTLAAIGKGESGTEAKRFENRYMCMDGSHKWLRWTCAPYEDLWYCVAHDVTAVKQAEAALHQANDDLEKRVVERTAQLENSHREMSIAKEEAERANAAKSDFLSRMSHELRTPMNSILGFAQIMEMDAPSPKQAARIGHIITAGQHLLQLINEVLDLARVESGRLQLSSETVSIGSCLQSAIDMIRPLCAPRDLQIICHWDECEPFYVHADQQRLSQVLINLLSNATKYNRDGGSIRVHCEQSRKGRHRVSISDSGPGIAAEQMAMLFQPFERLGADGSSIEGTGLGLALSKRLVELMGGTLSVESKMGVGSTFVVDLPGAENLAQEIQTMPQTPAMPDVDGRQHAILYIEDDLSNLQLIEHVLASHPQYQLRSAQTGLRGLEMAHERPLSLILLDLHLPDLSGYEVLGRLQADPFTRDIPVVIVSADATSSQIQRLLTAGAVEYLTKPLDVRLFNDVLHKILHSKEGKDG